MEEWRGYTAESRPDSSPSSLLDGGASDVLSYTQRSQAPDYMFLSQQQQQQQQQHQQGLQQQFMQQQYIPQQMYSAQQQQQPPPGYPTQPGIGLTEQQQQQALDMADYMEREQQREREIARKQQTALRRGLLSVSELEDWMGEDCPQLDRQTLIRFPPEVAETLRQRLHNAAAAAAAAAAEGIDPPEPGAAALGLTIIPRPDYNYRAFDVKVSGYRGRLRGILVELPTLIETYKTVDSDILFKSAFACHTRNSRVPGAYSLLFVFVDQLLHGLRRDTYEIEVHTELDMLEARKKEQEQQTAQQQGSTASPDAPRVERVVLTTEDVTELLNMIEEDDDYLSDASDILFSIQSDNVSLPGADPNSRSRRGKGGGPGGPSRFSSVGNGGQQETDSPQTGMMTPNSQLQMQMSQQQHLQQQFLSQQQGQQLLHGMPEGLTLGGEVDDAEERERLRLRKERRKQKKDRKRARREQKLQQQQQQQQAAMGQGLPSDQMVPDGAMQSAIPLQTDPEMAALGEGSAVGGNDDGNLDGMSSVGSADGQ
ncbi:uncharacterized protein EMH_0041790 [Eimeria mitis]|uniref:TAFII55 protein conserved region domain-containing protein n=1 Tax=Eimeria mitis TaxID=44415 RepID=U6K2Z6_9EIME|nr:uncharacterized protein EMH_0041790 [Eimeria mitis]CDJ32100.1 hypothetical protein, conserved [Eimeria mitis]